MYFIFELEASSGYPILEDAHGSSVITVLKLGRDWKGAFLFPEDSEAHLEPFCHRLGFSMDFLSWTAVGHQDVKSRKNLIISHQH